MTDPIERALLDSGDRIIGSPKRPSTRPSTLIVHTEAGHCDPGSELGDCRCNSCVDNLMSPRERLAALRASLETESEPLVAVTHLLRLCRDEHATLWENLGNNRTDGGSGTLDGALPEAGTEHILTPAVRKVLRDALDPERGIEPALVAHHLANLLDDRYGHTFSDSFRARSPYQPATGDPIPLGTPDLRRFLDMRPTPPPWRMANRLDETRKVRLAGQWATQFRLVFDYSLYNDVPGLITRDTIIATCHPNRHLDDFRLADDLGRRGFGVGPRNLARQKQRIDELIGRACAAGARIIVLPELCVDEELAGQLRHWVSEPEGPQLLVAGSFHHLRTSDADGSNSTRRCNTAIAWVRGRETPLLQDKHSPADRPVIEDIQPDGWPTLHVYVTADGWHLSIAVCRDLLNPHAVHALTEAGANLVLVPAMSETLASFGGPAAQIVGTNHALIAVANNPAEWPDHRQGFAKSARGLFGHPGMDQQTRFVQSGDAESGIGLLEIRTAHISWLEPHPPISQTHTAISATVDAPPWAQHLARRFGSSIPMHEGPVMEGMRRAAVLLLLCDAEPTPVVLLTQRSPDLSDYPDKLVLPGGAAEPGEDPIATALRETKEEVGVDPASVHVLGTLPMIALLDAGFLVTPVLAWTRTPPRPIAQSAGEVSAIYLPHVGELVELLESSGDEGCEAPMRQMLGDMTRDLLNLVLPSLPSPQTPKASPPLTAS